ncbi:hypothetical protein [Lysinibacillus fusiformis]|uniref:hypothetical protein n=1 Tax=Lysinibacillus fusiformis TaxID=28031 RepID=UPI00187F7296|nr:hypothetical protein [Lysinibacillus fusiformis]MBD8524048.1 hypothetical protein [Lysinibacillus fusiformis]
MDKEKVKVMICKAIDNIPNCADIVDCYTEHSFGDSQAFIKVVVKVNEATEENLTQFHNIAHKAFDSNMGFTS